MEIVPRRSRAPKAAVASAEVIPADVPDYPVDLDPFKDEEEIEESKDKLTDLPGECYPEDLDPFCDDEEKSATPNDDDDNNNNDDYNGPDDDRSSSRFDSDSLETSTISASRVIISNDYDDSLNPFGDEDDDEGDQASGRSSKSPIEHHTDSDNEIKYRQQSSSKGTKINGHSDNITVTDSSSSNNNATTNGTNSRLVAPIPAPRKSLSNRASTSALSSCDRASYSTSSLGRRKQTSSPVVDRLSLGQVDSDIRHSIGNLSCLSVQSSSASSPARSRKKRRAPAPPGLNASSSSHGLNGSHISATTSDAISINSDLGYTPNQSGNIEYVSKESDHHHQDEKNLDDQSASNVSPSVRSTDGDSDTSINNMDKTTFGYWRRRKKRQAPAIPIPKRNIITIPLSEIQAESNLIADKQSNVERRMNHLEKSLIEENQRSKLKRLVMEYLQLAREKCQLAKRQDELSCLKKQHELQQQQIEIEYQIRILDAKQFAIKTKDDEDRCEELCNRIVEVVDKRNDIEEEMIQINKRPEYDQLVDKLKRLKIDQTSDIDTLVSDCLKKERKNREEKLKKDARFESSLRSKIGKISTLKRHISKQI
ncbi:MICAL-like protein [Brevipalpus obovatus]|uniref:MICAL-like protein n=1 Tax=Brevipalpus obovatus TaxID=246614 RepID=UPI003D9E2C58